MESVKWAASVRHSNINGVKHRGGIPVQYSSHYFKKDGICLSD